MKTPALRFSTVRTENILTEMLLENVVSDDVTIIIVVPCSSVTAKCKMTGDCCVVKFLRRSADATRDMKVISKRRKVHSCLLLKKVTLIKNQKNKLRSRYDQFNSSKYVAVSRLKCKIYRWG